MTSLTSGLRAPIRAQPQPEATPPSRTTPGGSGVAGGQRRPPAAGGTGRLVSGGPGTEGVVVVPVASRWVGLLVVVVGVVGVSVGGSRDGLGGLGGQGGRRFGVLGLIRWLEVRLLGGL